MTDFFSLFCHQFLDATTEERGIAGMIYVQDNGGWRWILKRKKKYSVDRPS